MNWRLFKVRHFYIKMPHRFVVGIGLGYNPRKPKILLTNSGNKAETIKSRVRKIRIKVKVQEMTLKNFVFTYSPIMLFLLAISTMKMRIGGKRTPLTTWVVNMT